MSSRVLFAVFDSLLTFFQQELILDFINVILSMELRAAHLFDQGFSTGLGSVVKEVHALEIGALFEMLQDLFLLNNYLGSKLP